MIYVSYYETSTHLYAQLFVNYSENCIVTKFWCYAPKQSISRKWQNVEHTYLMRSNLSGIIWLRALLTHVHACARIYMQEGHMRTTYNVYAWSPDDATSALQRRVGCHHLAVCVYVMIAHLYRVIQKLIPLFTTRCTIVQSAVLRSHFVCPSVCDVGGLWSHRLEFFENNFTVS